MSVLGRTARLRSDTPESFSLNDPTDVLCRQIVRDRDRRDSVGSGGRAIVVPTTTPDILGTGEQGESSVSQDDERESQTSVDTPESGPEARRSWTEAARAFLHRRVIAIFFLGISAGVPLLLIFGTLSVWLREAGVARSTVTFFSWAVLGYSFKFVWAPVIDSLPVPWLTRALGRRRSWLVVSQAAVISAMLWMAATDPQQSLTMTAMAAVLLGFSSATQDITIDAYRIEAVERDLQAMMSSAYMAGYRTGMLVAGAGALKLASYFGSTVDAYSHRAWALAYVCMAASMLVGVVTTFMIREPEVAQRSEAVRAPGDYVRFVALFLAAAAVFVLGFVWSKDLADQLKAYLETDLGWMKHLAGLVVESLRLGISVVLAVIVARLLIAVKLVPEGMVRESYVEPITDFMGRFGRSGFLVLLLIGSYRMSDLVMGAVANVFYIDMGFTKDQIADIAKTFGLLMIIAGGFLGGVLSVRYGLSRILFLGATLAAATNLLFALLATMGNNAYMLIVVIAADNLSMGLASAAFIAYLSSLTSIRFTATQYALFSSLMTLVPKTLAGYSGSVVDSIGYPWFFIGSAILGLPVLWLVVIVSRLEGGEPDMPPEATEGSGAPAAQ